jgi:adenylate kinase family enzyme
VIARRLELYHEQTSSVVERYRATGKLVPLHADRSIDAVYAEIQEALQLLEDGAAA